MQVAHSSPRAGATSDVERAMGPPNTPGRRSTAWRGPGREGRAFELRERDRELERWDVGFICADVASALGRWICI